MTKKRTNGQPTNGQPTANTNGQTANNKNNNALSTLITNYNNDTNNGQPTADSLTALATAVTFSVLKKCCLVSHDRTLETVRRSLVADLAKVEISAHDTASDGMELVNVAALAILNETAAQREREPGQPTDIERPYTVRRLKRKIYIQTADSAAFETVETSPIREIYKAVRRSIGDSAAVTVASNKYTYLEELATDSETDTETAIYRRLPKYSQLASADTMDNITADAQTVADVDSILEKLNLTDRQAVILRYRLSGYGYKAIATALGVTDSTIKAQIKEIRRKYNTRIADTK